MNYRLIERFCLVTNLKFSLLSGCKSNLRVVLSRYWGLSLQRIMFFFFGLCFFFYVSEKELITDLEIVCFADI